jgi:hypothetical protein
MREAQRCEIWDERARERTDAEREREREKTAASSKTKQVHSFPLFVSSSSFFTP